MKKILLYALALLLLLTACYPRTEIPSDNSRPTSGGQETASDPILQETTQSIGGPTDPTELELSADVCLLTKRETLTYEDFFGENRVYADSAFSGRTDWIIPSDGGAMVFGIKLGFSPEEALYIDSPASAGRRYVIPGSDAYISGYNLLSADGMYAYFQNTEEIVQLDMRTGNARQIVRCDYINSAYICGRDALYYAAVTDGKLAINRLYIPTMQLDILYDDFSSDTPHGENELYLYKPTSTQGDVVWYCVNPAMTEQIRKETANPDSKFISLPLIDITPLWGEGDPIDPDLSRERLWLYKCIQQDTGIRSFLEITYNQTTGEHTERHGVIDDCWFGSGYPHDHYSLENTEKEAPVPADGQWIDVPDIVPIRGEVSAVAYSDRFMPCTLYSYDNGVLREKLIETPVIGVYGAFCVTEDGTLIQISSDGSTCNTLYKVKDKIREFEQFRDKLYFLDGNTMVELDLSEAKCRTIVEYTNITEMYLDNIEDTSEFAEIYFAVEKGLFVEGYVYYVATSEIVQKGYRL